MTNITFSVPLPVWALVDESSTTCAPTRTTSRTAFWEDVPLTVARCVARLLRWEADSWHGDLDPDLQRLVTTAHKRSTRIAMEMLLVKSRVAPVERAA